jgi:hypothetical protein
MNDPEDRRDLTTLLRVKSIGIKEAARINTAVPSRRRSPAFSASG